jgi:hypothetical protein
LLAVRNQEEEVHMKEYSPEHALARMTASVPTPAEGRRQRYAIEDGRTLFAWLQAVWRQIEAEEALAYEDKLTIQVRLLDEAIPDLAQLYNPLRHTRRQLKGHLRTLRRLTSQPQFLMDHHFA